MPPTGGIFTLLLHISDGTQPKAKPMAPQISALVVLILLIEFSCLLLYASGGRTLRHFLARSGNVTLMNRIAGSLMLFVGVWLAFG